MFCPGCTACEKTRVMFGNGNGCAEHAAAPATTPPQTPQERELLELRVALYDAAMLAQDAAFHPPALGTEASVRSAIARWIALSGLDPKLPGAIEKHDQAHAVRAAAQTPSDGLDGLREWVGLSMRWRGAFVSMSEWLDMDTKPRYEMVEAFLIAERAPRKA